jgi:hypothetical protein
MSERVLPEVTGPASMPVPTRRLARVFFADTTFPANQSPRKTTPKSEFYGSRHTPRERLALRVYGRWNQNRLGGEFALTHTGIPSPTSTRKKPDVGWPLSSSFFLA